MCEYNFKMQLQRAVQDVQYPFSLNQYLILANLWSYLNIFISRRINSHAHSKYMIHDTLLLHMYLHTSLIIWHCLIVTRIPHAEHVYTLHDSHMYPTYWSHVHHMLTIFIHGVLHKCAPHDDHMFMYPTCWTYRVHIHILLSNHMHTPNI